MNNYKINSKQELKNYIGKNWELVNNYINEKSEGLELPLYTSVDIRESRDKFAPVDNNIYPAGFNNICMLDQMICQDHFKKYFNKLSTGIKNIALIPESHTKNLFYLDHLATLQNILIKAGFNVEIITVDEAVFGDKDQIEITSMSEYSLTIYKASLENGCLTTKTGTNFQAYVLNNDQSSPLNIEWNSIKALVLPTPKIGWFRRQKIEHFIKYNQVADDFCQHFSIDPNLIQASFIAVDEIDFSTKEGIDKLADAVDELKSQLSADTSIFVKASQGTYGMGISVVQSGEEIRNMNRKARNKMDIGKNKIKFTKVLVQEGVETIIKYDDNPAEVTIYLVGGQSVGGFMRANPEKDSKSNLNSRGMVYKKFCISELREVSDYKQEEATYSIIARLSTLAAALEITDIENNF